MTPLSDAGAQLVRDMAGRHGVSEDAVSQMLHAVAAGGGTQAQFSIPELGGMGQWSQGGMTMVGDMFNDALKGQVSALCADLSAALAADTLFAPPAVLQSQSQGASAPRLASASQFFAPDPTAPHWPTDLGPPASTGSQNDVHYAWFPAHARLAISRAGQVVLYDTGAHQISGFGQALGAGASLSFTSQLGQVSLSDLTVVSREPEAVSPEPSAVSAEPSAGSTEPATVSPEPSAVSPEPVAAPPHPGARAAEPARDGTTEQASAPAAADPTPSLDAPAATPNHAPLSDDQIFTRLERLADLRDRGILEEAEFAAKKAELLARL